MCSSPRLPRRSGNNRCVFELSSHVASNLFAPHRARQNLQCLIPSSSQTYVKCSSTQTVVRHSRQEQSSYKVLYNSLLRSQDWPSHLDFVTRFNHKVHPQCSSQGHAPSRYPKAISNRSGSFTCNTIAKIHSGTSFAASQRI